MARIKVTYICYFSTPDIRSRLRLKTFKVGNLLRRIIGRSLLCYNDSGTWNADFIKAFEGNDEFECHVISHHLGLLRKEERFDLNGVKYVILQEKENIFGKIRKTLFHSPVIDDSCRYAHQIITTINEINPHIVVVCGAENPIYSSSILQIRNKPVFVILQTWLNSPKRIEMGVGSASRRELENSVFYHAGYFGSHEKEAADYIKERNTEAQVFKVFFPSTIPAIVFDGNKQYDFVFFSNGLSKNKGIEDVLKGFGYVRQRHPSATLIIIGRCSPEYMTHLNEIMTECCITSSVYFFDHYPSKADALNKVVKARIAVLPGITASLNSTVRETMMMSIPTIVYSNSVIDAINQHEHCLLTAEMENTESLGRTMLYAYEKTDKVLVMAEHAKDYAMNYFSVEAVRKVLIADIKAIVNHYYLSIAIPKELLVGSSE